MEATQRTLTEQQIEAFHHDSFVDTQVRDFVALIPAPSKGRLVVDVGGGCGFFAKRLSESSDWRVRVLDMDPSSIDACRRSGVDAVSGDALDPPITGQEHVVCFNLILHHLIGGSEAATVELQRKALQAWRTQACAVFVNEYIYESLFAHISGRLIFEITKSRALSWIGRKVAIFLPSLRANTFGVGVRFRAHEEWKRLFASAGYTVKAVAVGKAQITSLPLRLLMIKEVRLDSFLLEPSAAWSHQGGDRPL